MSICKSNVTELGVFKLCSFFRHKQLGRIAKALVLTPLIAACGEAIEVHHIRGGEHIAVEMSSDKPAFLADLKRIGGQHLGTDDKQDPVPYEFVIDPRVVPSFSVYAGRVANGELVVVGQVVDAKGNQQFTTYRAAPTIARINDVESLDDWRAHVGEEAKVEQLRHVQNCYALSYREALKRYGYSSVVVPKEGVILFLDHGNFLDCELANASLAYALVLNTDKGKFLASNILGRIFIEELTK